MEYGTIKIPKDEYDKHNDRRQDLGLTWAEYIDGEAPDAPDTDIGPVTLEATEHKKISEGVADELADHLR